MCQPFTFRGLAGFAQASLFRVFVFQIVFAVAAGVCVSASLGWLWVPMITRAIASLPPGAEIRDQRLHWPTPDAVRLAENSALDIVADPQTSYALGQTADVQMMFTEDAIRFRSLSALMVIPFPPGVNLTLSRALLDPWWGAWKPGVLFVIGAIFAAHLIIIWWLIGILYACPIKFICFFADRPVTWRRAWQVAEGAFLPGAVLFSIGILCYGLHQASLPALLFIAAAHIVVGWIYVFAAPFFIPKSADTTGKKDSRASPFAPPTPPETPADSTPPKKKSGNPFS